MSDRIKARPTRLRRVALPERQPVEEELLDPTAIQRNYRRQRIKRRAREDRARERNLARLRFWLALAAVLATSIALAVVIWNQIQRLFGL
jgi:Flp pilus assembly protein TadB